MTTTEASLSWTVRKAFRSLSATGSLRGRFARGALWSLIGTVLSQGLGLAASVIGARFLGKAGYGELGIVNSTVGMFGMFAGFGLGLTTTKYVAELRATDPERAGRIIGLSSIVAVVSGGLISLGLLVWAPFLATHSLNEPQLAVELRIASLLLFLNALNGVQTGTLAGLEAFKAIAQANLVRGLLSFPVLIGGVLLWGLPGAVWGLVAAAAIGWLINHVFLSKKCRSAGICAQYSGIWGERRILWSFSLPAILANAAAGPVMWYVAAMLVNQPNGYSEMGVFNAAAQWRTAVLFLPTLIGQVVLPILSSLQGQPDRGSVPRVLRGAVLLNAAIVAPVALPMILMSGPIMALYGPGFASRGMVLRLTALTAAVLAIEAPVGDTIASTGRMWLGALMNLAWAAVLLISAWSLLRRRWGADGIAGAYLIAYLVHALWTFWFASRVVRGKLNPSQPDRAIIQENILDSPSI